MCGVPFTCVCCSMTEERTVLSPLLCLRTPLLRAPRHLLALPVPVPSGCVSVQCAPSFFFLLLFCLLLARHLPASFLARLFFVVVSKRRTAPSTSQHAHVKVNRTVAQMPLCFLSLHAKCRRRRPNGASLRAVCLSGARDCKRCNPSEPLFSCPPFSPCTSTLLFFSPFRLGPFDKTPFF